DVLGRVRHGQREEARVWQATGHLDATAVGHVDVKKHDVGLRLLDQRHRVVDRAGLADDLDAALELAAHTRAEESVVVDEYDALHSASSTSVPPPGWERTSARPPWRCMRPMIDSRTPRRSDGTAPGSNPAPRSRTKTSARSSARRWISASVCSTESCRCAATSARSWARMRAVRSAVSACVIRSHQGPNSSTLPASRTITGNANDCTSLSAGSARATSTA